MNKPILDVARCGKLRRLTMKLLKRIFCRHRIVRFVRNIYGDEINTAHARSMWHCTECGKFFGSDELATDGSGEPYKAEDRPYIIRARRHI